MDEKLCSGGKENGVGPSFEPLARAAADCCEDASGTASDGELNSTVMTPANPEQTTKSAMTAPACSEDQERVISRTVSIACMSITIDVELQIDDIGVDGGASVAQLRRTGAHIDIVDEQQR